MGGSNLPVDSARSKDYKRGSFQENVLYLFLTLIFSGTGAVLLCLVGSFRDLTFLPVIVLNTLDSGSFQETRAKIRVLR